jgi:HSP20 family protein
MANMIPGGRRHTSPIERRRNPLEELRREFDYFLDGIMGGWPAPTWGEDGGRRPWGLDVSTQENEMVVKAELPGWDPNDLDIQIRGDQLIIRGEKEQKEGGNAWQQFEEFLSVPAGMEADKVKATYRNGVLELHMPLPENARPRRIAIQSDAPSSEKAQIGTEAKTMNGASSKEQKTGTTSSSK